MPIGLQISANAESRVGLLCGGLQASSGIGAESRASKGPFTCGQASRDHTTSLDEDVCDSGHFSCAADPGYSQSSRYRAASECDIEDANDSS
jgi:hypothetical protein